MPAVGRDQVAAGYIMYGPSTVFVSTTCSGVHGFTLDSAVGQHGSASVVPAGGRTPRGVYQRLAASHRHDVPWDHVHFYWGDSGSFRMTTSAATTA